jgi:hypothetical protein
MGIIAARVYNDALFFFTNKDIGIFCKRPELETMTFHFAAKIA